MWSCHTGHCLSTLEGHRDRVSALAVLNNGNVVSCSYDETLKVWDVAQGMGQCGAWGTSAGWQFMGPRGVRRVGEGRCSEGAGDATQKPFSATASLFRRCGDRTVSYCMRTVWPGEPRTLH